MLKFFASVYEVGKDLVEILGAMGKLGFYLGLFFYKITRLINFILNLGWPLNAIVAAPVIGLAFYFRELLSRGKLLLLAALGGWIYWKMSVEAVRQFGLSLAGIGLGIFFWDLLIRKGVIKPPSLFPKKNEKKGKKKKK